MSESDIFNTLSRQTELNGKRVRESVCTCTVYIGRQGLLAKDYQDSASVSKCPLCKAAPDLLEACRGLVREIRDRFPSLKQRTETAIGLEAEFRFAEAAIAKAEGRQ